MQNGYGRQTIRTSDGRTFVIEPIIPSSTYRAEWGDVNPATGKVEGSYGNKHRGGVTEEESIIREENGFRNIVTLGPGESPYSYIEKVTK